MQKEDKKEIALPLDYYRDNANVGLSDLDIEDVPIPTLSVVQSTSKWRDEEDRPYKPGKLYYKALKMAYDIVECHILVITKQQMPSYIDKTILERTYRVLGCLMPAMMPFMMYNKSSAYFKTREFIGEVKARKYPMYGLKVQISTERRQNDQGEWYVPVFTIVGIVTDPEQVIVLENLAKDYDMHRENLRTEEEEKHAIEASPQQVNPDDVPF